MVADGCEILVCLISLALCIKLNHDTKTNRFKSHRKEGVFFVQIVSDKDIVIVQSSKKPKRKQNSTLKITNKNKSNQSANKKKTVLHLSAIARSNAVPV